MLLYWFYFISYLIRHKNLIRIHHLSRQHLNTRFDRNTQQNNRSYLILNVLPAVQNNKKAPNLLTSHDSVSRVLSEESRSDSCRASLQMKISQIFRSISETPGTFIIQQVTWSRELKFQHSETDLYFRIIWHKNCSSLNYSWTFCGVGAKLVPISFKAISPQDFFLFCCVKYLQNLHKLPPKQLHVSVTLCTWLFVHLIKLIYNCVPCKAINYRCVDIILEFKSTVPTCA